MTTQNPHPWGPPYAGPPVLPVPPSSIPAKDIRPGRIYYLVAAILGFVLAALGVAFFAATVTRTVHAVDSVHTFPGGESRTFRFTAGTTKAIYVSQAGPGHVECRIPDMPSGSITQPGGSFRVTLGSRTWERVLEVNPTSTGVYTLACTADQPAEFALGDTPRMGPTIGGIAAGVGCLLAAFATTVTIVIVTAVRRYDHRRRLAAARTPVPQWGPPPAAG